MEAQLDIRQETRGKEVLRAKPQVFKQASLAETANRRTQDKGAYGSESTSRRDVHDRPKNDRGKDELHWLAQRDRNSLTTMRFALSTGLQDHRPDDMEPRPGKWNAGRYEDNC
eukprot:16319616-Heterocapsa_arctica.AAC.1